MSKTVRGTIYTLVAGTAWGVVWNEWSIFNGAWLFGSEFDQFSLISGGSSSDGDGLFY